LSQLFFTNSHLNSLQVIDGVLRLVKALKLFTFQDIDKRRQREREIGENEGGA